MRSRVASRKPKWRPRRDVPWRVIAFDLDDTLYPETGFVRSGFREVAIWSGENLNIDPDSTFRELIDLFESGVRGTVFDSWISNHGFSKDILGEMVRVYREHYPQIAPFPGVREMLSELRKEFRLGLLSDGFLAVQERKVSALSISQHFEAVIFSDRLGRDSWKPSSRPYLELMQILQVDPEETVYVGDNPAKDFVACRRLGMQSIWLRQSTGIYSALTPEPDASPDYIVDSIVGVTNLLKAGSLT
jgi:putative hydrolase of the HAD superfamily